jgi:hypothetical protein
LVGASAVNIYKKGGKQGNERKWLMILQSLYINAKSMPNDMLLLVISIGYLRRSWIIATIKNEKRQFIIICYGI